ncbi:MAG: hypothetical protein RR326_01000 [Stenotrophomonas sp.]
MFDLLAIVLWAPVPDVPARAGVTAIGHDARVLAAALLPGYVVRQHGAFVAMLSKALGCRHFVTEFAVLGHDLEKLSS